MIYFLPQGFLFDFIRFYRETCFAEVHIYSLSLFVFTEKRVLLSYIFIRFYYSFLPRKVFCRGTYLFAFIIRFDRERCFAELHIYSLLLFVFTEKCVFPRYIFIRFYYSFLPRKVFC